MKGTTLNRSFSIAGLIALFAVTVLGFWSTGAQYDDYRQIYGAGVTNIPAEELVFYLWYALFGGISAALLAVALAGVPLLDRIADGVKTLLNRPAFPALAVVVLFLEIICVRLVVLKDMPIADDEETYRFIAKTLLHGRLANPTPPDASFFQNQFIVLKGGLWYGKYPIGHPLFLALGEAVGLRFLVTPILTCITALLTFRVGCLLLDRTAAALALLLLLLSPQFVLMGATDLSQPASACFLMLALLFVLRHTEARRARYMLFTGIAFACALFVRPFPAVVCVPLFAAVLLIDRNGGTLRRRLVAVGVGAIPVALALLGLLLVNRALTGDPTVTGYHAAHADGASGAAGLGLLAVGNGVMATSVFGGLLRLNFWLLGWPLSFAFVFFSGFKQGAAWVWALIAGVLLYRVAVPKTVVATLGPVYFYEAIPPLLLLTAAGMLQCARRSRAVPSGTPSPRRRAAAAAIGSVLVSSLCFLPVPLRDAGRSASLRSSLLGRIHRTVGKNAIVFAHFLVDPTLRATWAPHPPNNSPTLDDDVIWVRPKHGADGARENIAFWKRNFPSRSAWRFGFSKNGPYLKPVRSERDFRQDE